MKNTLKTIVGLLSLIALNSNAEILTYGELNASAKHSNSDNKYTLNETFIGFKGLKQFNRYNLKAIYRAEIRLNDDMSLETKNLYAGFKGKYGLIAFGQHEFLSFGAQAKDLFFNTIASNETFSHGIGFDGKGYKASHKSALIYATPRVNNFGVVALASSNNEKEKPSFSDSGSIVASFGDFKEGFYGAIAFDFRNGIDDSYNLYKSNSIDERSNSISLHYIDPGKLYSLSALYHSYENTSSVNKDKSLAKPTSGNNLQASAALHFSNIDIKFKYSKSQKDSTLVNPETINVESYAIGVGVNLDEQNSVQVTYLTDEDNRNQQAEVSFHIKF